MSGNSFIGKVVRSVFGGGSKPKSNAADEARKAREAAAAETRAQAAADQQRQTAKQFAAINTPSRGFGSNSLENLSRSFLLRL